MDIMFRRHGDINLHPVKKVLGEKMKSNGSFVLAEGEATGSKHIIAVANPADLEVWKDALNDVYIKLNSVGTITHTHDHETITIQPGIYRQIPEREVDHFNESITRRVID